MDESQCLYLAASKIHGTGVFAAKRLHQGQCYAPELLRNETVRDVYHYLDCLTLFPERTNKKLKFNAIVVLVDTDFDRNSLQRGLAVVPRHYVSYLNHAKHKVAANAKIGIRINGRVMDFLPWIQSVCPLAVESLNWGLPGLDSQPLRKRLSGFIGLSALRSLLEDSDHKIELVIIPIDDIQPGQELLIFYGTHDVTRDNMLHPINTNDKAKLRLVRELCVCHRKTVTYKDKLLEYHMNMLEGQSID